MSEQNKEIAQSADKEINIAACLHPFSTKSIRSVAQPGLSLFQIFNEPTYVAIFQNGHNAFVFVNDQLIEKENWFSFYPNPGDIISIKVFPMGGGSSGNSGSGKSAGRIVAMIGVAILAIVTTYLTAGALAPYWGATLAGMAGAAAGMAVSVAGNLLINSLIPISSQKKTKEESSNFSITGTRNAFEPYGAVTKLFGKHKQFPKYAAMPYTELVGQDCYLRCLFLIGKGKYRISEHKIGENAIATYSNVEMEEYFSGDSNSSYALYPNTVHEDQINVQMTSTNGWHEQATPINTDEISIEISFPQGLRRNNDDGHMSTITVGFSLEYAPYETENWSSITNEKRYYFSGTPNIGIVAGLTVVGNTSGATGVIRYAHATSTNTFAGHDGDGNEINIYTAYCDWATIDCTSGVFQVETITVASTYPATISSFEAVAGLSISAETRTLYKGSYNLHVTRGQWKVRIQRLTFEDSDWTSDCYWTAIRSLRHEPPVVMPGCTLIGMRIKATDQLNGIVDQYNLICESILPAWDGTDWNDVVTRNPAWAFCEVMMGNSNERPVLSDRLEMPDILTWAQNCADAGRNFDYVLDTQTTVWEFLKDICAVGRAAPGVIDNKFTVIQDIAQTVPIQHFSPRNSWGFKGSRAFPDFPHAFRITFTNELENYIKDEITIYDDGYTISNATKFENLNFPGIVNSDQIWKLARYHLFCVRLRPEIFEFSADIEHMVCTRGDLIRLTHDVIKIGLGQGRILSMTTSGSNIETLTFDDVFPMGPSGTYGCQYRKQSDSTYGTFTVNRVQAYNLTVTLNPQISIATGPDVGDLCFFGEAGEESLPCIVSRIEAGPDFSAKITAVNYDSRIYTDSDSGDIPPWDSGITQPPIINIAPPTPNIESWDYSYKTANLNDDGTYDIWMDVSFSSQQTGFVQGSPDAITGFQAQYCQDDGRWVTIELSKDARTFSFNVQNGSSYDIRIRSLSTPGNYSAWDSETDIVIALVGTTPPNVSGLQLKGGGTVFTGSDIDIEWNAIIGSAVPGLRIKDYEVVVCTPDGLTILRTEYVTDSFYTYTWNKNLIDGGPRPSVQFKLKARTIWDNLSATAAILTVTNAAPATPTGLGTQEVMGGVEFYWTANTEPDLKYYQTRIKISVGGTFSAWTPLQATGILRFLTAAEKVTYGSDATIYIEVMATDIFLQSSAAAAANGIAGSLDIEPTDIADFAIRASKLFVKIPVIENLTLTNNSPSAGLISWTECQLYYNGVKYSISASHTEIVYVNLLPTTPYVFVYWKYQATSFAWSIAHPSTLSGWTPGRDFIIATCTNGIGQEAWNAIANQVIGSAYIMNAAIQDAHIASLSGTKINASTSVSIGSTTYGNDGIQLEYNVGNPRFYAGNGATKFVKFDGTDVDINGKVTIGSGSSGYSNISDKPADDTILNSYNLNPGNMAAFPNFEGLSTPGTTNLGYLGGWQFTTTHPLLPVNYIMNYIPAWNCVGANTACIWENAPYGGTEGDHYSYFSSQSFIPIIEGKNYCFSVYSGSHRCQTIAYASFYNSSSTYLGQTSFSSNNNAYSGGPTLSGYFRHVSYGVAPVGAVFARLHILKYQTKVGQINSYLFCCRPMFSEIGLNQTTAPPWSAGGTDNTGWMDTNGLITAAALGETIITGGYIKTSLLTADNIQTGTLQAARVGVLGTSHLDSTVISGGKIVTNLLTADNIQTGTLVADRIAVDSLIYNKISSSDGGRITPISSYYLSYILENTNNHITDNYYYTTAQIVGGTIDRVLLVWHIDSIGIYNVGVAEFYFSIYRVISGVSSTLLFSTSDFNAMPLDWIRVDDPGASAGQSLYYYFRYYMYGSNAGALSFTGSKLSAIQFRR